METMYSPNITFNLHLFIRASNRVIKIKIKTDKQTQKKTPHIRNVDQTLKVQEYLKREGLSC